MPDAPAARRTRSRRERVVRRVPRRPARTSGPAHARPMNGHRLVGLRLTTPGHDRISNVKRIQIQSGSGRRSRSTRNALRVFQVHPGSELRQPGTPAGGGCQMKPHPHGSAQRHSARFALLLPLLLSALVMVAPGPSVRAQASCTSDADCDNGRFCDGLERCDISGGACVPGTPVTCNDSNPCTIDYCDEVTRGCATIATGDDETAEGQDGYCHTLDDNLSLYGNDGLCGTGDDRTGDGVCSAIDNCSFVFNPSQEDDNHNGLGNACEPSPCPGRRGYLTDGSTLWVLDLLTGYPVHMIGGLHQPQGVAVNAGETLAYVTESGTNSVMQIDLETSAAVSLGSGLLNPSSIKLNRTGSLLYVTEYDPGYLTQVPAYPGSTSVRLVGGLSGPRGLALNPTGTKAYIGEFVGGTLKAVDLGTTGVATIATGLSGPSGVALNPAGTTAYVTEYSSGELSAVNLSNGAVTLIRGGLNSPTDL